MEKYLTEEKCCELFKIYNTPAHVIGHCRAVNDVAVKVGKALIKCGCNLDIDVIYGASLIHDVARVEEKHWEVGAKILSDLGYQKEADIVEHHMFYPDFSPISQVNETDIVCLGDRVVIDDTYVGLGRRMRYVINKGMRAGQNDIVEIIAKKKASAQRFIDEIYELTCLTLDEIVGTPVDSLLDSVEKPARYMGGEIYSAMKDEAFVDLRFGFAFPDMYEIGMSYLGLQILYNILNKEDGIFCERIFSPAPDMEKLLRDRNIPLFTLETKMPIDKLDILGFTLQYEMCYTNVLNILDLGGIPLRSKDRNETHPLIIAGGPCACNPEPLADFVDVFLIGDGEDQLPSFCNLYRKMKAESCSTDAFLKVAVKDIDGVYVPKFYEPVYNEDGTVKKYAKLYSQAPDKVRKAIISDLNKAEYPVNPIVPFIETVHDRAVVEIFRGCTRGCRFCQAGMVYRPLRERKKEQIIDYAIKQLDNTGHEELSLLSLSTSDYSDFEDMAEELLDRCRERNVSLSLPSLRLDSFSFNILDKIQGYKKSGLTFAPEAGTQRLRDVINKCITEEDIYGSVSNALELGWNTVKLYFMIGLPTETTEDLDGIGTIAAKIKQLSYEIRGRQGGRFRETVSISNFIPKPHTPFQWEPQDTDDMMMKKHDYLKTKLSIKGVTFNYHDSKISKLEALFAKGDRRLSNLLEAAFKAGCKFDGWTEYFDEDNWNLAIENLTVDTGFYINRQIPYDEILPWDIIDMGISKDFLIIENKKAHTENTTVDCRQNCNACGVSRFEDCIPKPKG